MATTQHRVSLAPHVGHELDHLLLWRDPIKTGAVLGSITMAYYLLGRINVLQLTLYTFAVVVAGALVWAQGGSILGRSGPPVPAILEGFSEESWNKLAITVRPHVNILLNYLGVLVSGKNVALSLKVLGGSLAAAYVLRYVSLLGLAATVAALAFSVPKIYELRKDDCDRLIAQGQGKLGEVWAKLDETVFKKATKPAVKKD